MKKHICTILLLLLLATNDLIAQDLIYVSKRESPIEAKIVKIGPMLVRYKKFNYQDGPELSVPKRSVDSIIYDNGDVERLKAVRPPHHPAPRRVKPPKEYQPLGDNIFSAGFQRHKVGFDPFGSQYYYRSRLKNEALEAVYFSYERKFWKDRIGTEVTPFIGENNTRGVSVAARIYPSNWGKVRFGMGAEYTLLAQELVSSYRSESSYEVMYARQKVNASILTFTTRMLVNITPRYSFNLQLFGGELKRVKVKQQQLPENWNHSYDEAVFGIRLGFGYRF